MKRLFVRPAFRGNGVGRLLAERAIAEARVMGYTSMRLDTLPLMAAATSLYESLGFTRIPAYYATQLQDAIFMELKLQPPGPHGGAGEDGRGAGLRPLAGQAQAGKRTRSSHSHR